MDNTNRILQGSVDYVLQEQSGAVAQERLVMSFDIDADTTTAIKYGEFVEMGTNKGASKLDASTAVAGLLGVVPYTSSGIINDQGYNDGFYSNVPVLKKGVIYVSASGTIDLDSTLYLQVDPTKLDYGLVRNGATTGAINISTVAKAVKKQANGLVLIDLNI
jgi:hypothetical protein